MSIRQRKSKKSTTGFTYQVYFNYVDSFGLSTLFWTISMRTF